MSLAVRCARLILCLGLSVLGACGAKHYEKTPDGIVVSPAGGPARKLSLKPVSAKLIRVTAVPGDSLELPASLMALHTGDYKTPFEVTERDGSVVLKTAELTAEVAVASGQVTFRDPAGKVLLAELADGRSFKPEQIGGQDFYEVRQRFASPDDEAFYGLGQHQNRQMNYKNEDVELAQHNMDVAIPFLVSSRNYGLLLDNNSITRFGDPREYQPVGETLKLYDADGKEGGLTARYYVGDTLKLTRVESAINYQYNKDLQAWPQETKGQRQQKVVWEGRIEARNSGLHKFRLYASEYAKVYVDGRLVVDSWRQNWNPWYRNFRLELKAGEPRAIRVEWLPNDGYLALLHLDPLPDGQQGELSLDSEAGHAVDYYFVAGHNLDEVIAGYRQLTGKAVLLPRWAYGFWQSRERYKRGAELLDTVKEYRKRGLPLDNIVEDWHYWKEDSWGSHQFDPQRFPDPKGLVEQLHALHTQLMISVWPKFYPTTRNYQELDAKGYIYRRNVELGQKDWVGPGYLSSFYDPYAEEARKIYWRQIRESLDVLGVDAWWLDASEPDIQSNIDIAERKLRMGPTALGPGAAFFNSYPLMHTTAVYTGNRAADTGKRVFILTRSAFAGQQRNAAATWSGDVASRWDDLHNQISAGVNFSLSGIPNWTFDIGGFALEQRYEKPDAQALAEWRELNLRWFQFGAFAPLFRSHGQFPYREIYNLAPQGSEVYEALAYYDRLRYRLLPYIYTLAGDTYHRDATIMRGLVMDFPDDAKARNLDDEYLFGPAFLVAPVYAYQARRREVYLPAGASWYDFYSGTRYDGGQVIDAAAPLARMPLFVRAGAIVPTGPAIEYTGEKPDAPITLLVYTGADGRFSLYEDEGLNYNYEQGAWSRIPLSYDEASGTLTIGKREGSFGGMQQQRRFNIRWINGPTPQAVDFDASPQQSVDYAGEAVTVSRGAVAAAH